MIQPKPPMADVELVACAGCGDVGQAGFRIGAVARQRVTVFVRLFGVHRLGELL